MNRAAQDVLCFKGRPVAIDTSQLRPYLIEFLCSKCGRIEYRQFVITDGALKAARDIRISAREFADLVVKEYRSDVPQSHVNPIYSAKNLDQVSGYEICLGPVCPVMVWSHAISDPKEGNQLQHQSSISKPWMEPNASGELPGEICCQRASGKFCYEHDPMNYDYDPDTDSFTLNIEHDRRNDIP